MKLAHLERLRHKYKQQLKTAEQDLIVFKKKLVIEDKKLKTSMALLKKQKEAKKIAENKEKEKLFLLKKSEAIYTAKIEKEKKRLNLLKKKKLEEVKKKRLALLKKKALEEEEKKRLKKQNSMTKVEEIAELDKLDLLESDKIGDELALFNQDKKKSTSGFKPFNKWFKFSPGFQNLGRGDTVRGAVKGTFTINPHSYYVLGTTVVLDINDYKNPYYQPDFSYSFGYSDWHMDTFSWNYSNYSNNKVSPKEGEERFNFDKGTWEFAYKSKVNKVSLSAKAKYVPVKDTKKLYLSAKTVILEDVSVSAQLQHNINTQQNRLTLSAKTFFYDKFFISGTIYEYYKPDSIGSNDGEYAYSFGWSDSRPFRPSIIYSNYYTPTRWDPDEGPKFDKGTLSIKFKLDF